MVFYKNLPVELWFIIYKIEHQQKYIKIINNIKKDVDDLNRANELILTAAWMDGQFGLEWSPHLWYNHSDLWTYIEHKIFVAAIVEGWGQHTADKYLSDPTSYHLPI